MREGRVRIVLTLDQSLCTCPLARHLAVNRPPGMGWRCPACARTWTLVLVEGPMPPHLTPYGTHGRNECGQIDTPYEWCGTTSYRRPKRWRPDPYPRGRSDG